MKKTKLIALTMVVALMLVGAGYAAWTDALEVHQTLNTGYLDVYFEDIKDNGEISIPTTDKSIMSGSVGYASDSEGGQVEILDKALITINNAYPGAEYAVNLRIKNNSTMAIKFKDWTYGGSLSVLDVKSIVGTLENGPISSAKPIDENTVIPVGAYVNVKIEIAVDGDNEVLEQQTNVYNAWIKPVFTQYNAD